MRPAKSLMIVVGLHFMVLSAMLVLSGCGVQSRETGPERPDDDGLTPSNVHLPGAASGIESLDWQSELLGDPAIVGDANDGQPADGVDFSVADRMSVIIPPCIPYAGSDVDPCERRATWDLENPFVEYDLFTPDVVPTIEESIMVLGTVSRSIDFIVRSIVIPGTTRCTEPEFRYRIWWLGRPPRQPAEPLLQCVTDIAVNEYIVGSGPSRLTVHARIPQVGCDSEDLACIGWAEREIGRRIEGNEWILLIGQPPDLGLSVWGITSYFMDVQRREDGTEVVTSWAKDFYDDAFYDNRDLWHVKSLNDSRLEMTLEEFKPVVKAAHQKYVEANGGRITTARDYLGREFPRLLTDASSESLSHLFSQSRALEHLDLTPAPPPPVPGENDPNPDGLVINDIIATRVAGGVAVPGGLTDFDTPTPIIEDDLSPTAEATATVEPEPTVTPEPAPTPEPEVVPTATPESDPVDTPTPEIDPTATPEPEVQPTATPEAEPTATPDPDAPVPTGDDDDTDQGAPGETGNEGPGETGNGDGNGGQAGNGDTPGG